MMTLKNCLLIFAFAALIRNLIVPVGYNFFSVAGFLDIFPFFILGCGLQRFKDFFSGKGLIIALLIVFIASIIMQQATWFLDISMTIPEHNALSLIVATSGIILLFRIRKDIPPISKLGYYAFGIYLFHVFGSAGSRIFLFEVGIHGNFVVFTTGLIAGLGFPILLELIMEKSPLFRRVFFGLR
jgi:peptidoglycan/LPS O-acetylase OafA/YrhL